MTAAPSKVRCDGFTLIETMVVIAIVGIVTLGAGVLLANGQQSWSRLSGRVYGDSSIDGFAAQNTFDAVCRKASLKKYVLNDSANSLELYYWNTGSTASVPEHYARFYQNGTDVFIERGLNQSGTWKPDTSTSVIKVARDVQTLKFDVQGTSIQMFMTYTDPDVMPVVCSAVRHND